MKKPVIIITHERAGTHLVINLVNHDKFGNFHTIGYIDDPKNHTIKDYMHTTYRDIMSNAYIENSVSKSHHQVEFMNEYLDYLFSKYNVIYVKRNILDVLNSYYKFIPHPDEKNFPKIEEWVFSKPDDIGRKFLQPYAPDPHIFTEPKNYIDRFMMHVNGWMKHKNNMLVLCYEDIINDYKNQKQIIEQYISKRIADDIPNVHDKRFPNFGPVKGIIGGYKETMSQDLINKINDYLKSNYS
jgi:hypothetical protein